MPDINAVCVVAFAGLVLSASPGPSMLYVLSRSIGQDRLAGMASAAGLAVGGFAHVLAAAAGLAAVFVYVPALYTVTQFVGAAYLLWLGVGQLRDGGFEGQTERVHPSPLLKVFAQGVLVEIANPKTLLFFVAFLPQFIEPERGAVTAQMLVLGALVPLTAMPSDLLIALAGGSMAQRLRRRRVFNRLLNVFGGLILIGLGLRILLA